MNCNYEPIRLSISTLLSHHNTHNAHNILGWLHPRLCLYHCYCVLVMNAAGPIQAPGHAIDPAAAASHPAIDPSARQTRDAYIGASAKWCKSRTAAEATKTGNSCSCSCTHACCLPAQRGVLSAGGWHYQLIIHQWRHSFFGVSGLLLPHTVYRRWVFPGPRLCTTTCALLIHSSPKGTHGTLIHSVKLYMINYM